MHGSNAYIIRLKMVLKPNVEKLTVGTKLKLNTHIGHKVDSKTEQNQRSINKKMIFMRV